MRPDHRPVSVPIAGCNLVPTGSEFMAKKKAAGGPTKSAAVREYLQQHPDATAKDVVPALAAQGIEVKEGLVSVIRSSLKRKGGRKGVKKKVARNGRAARTGSRAGKAPRGARSQAVREYLSQNPDASPRQVVSALAAQGIDVKETLVGSIKYGKRAKTAGRKKGPGRAKPSRANGTLTSDDLLEAKRLAERLGGIEQVRAALETLEQLI